MINITIILFRIILISHSILMSFKISLTSIFRFIVVLGNGRVTINRIISSINVKYFVVILILILFIMYLMRLLRSMFIVILEIKK